jgi:hypothetical protein
MAHWGTLEKPRIFPGFFPQTPVTQVFCTQQILTLRQFIPHVFLSETVSGPALAAKVAGMLRMPSAHQPASVPSRMDNPHIYNPRPNLVRVCHIRNIVGSFSADNRTLANNCATLQTEFSVPIIPIHSLTHAPRVLKK